jgi:hypothetical protein
MAEDALVQRTDAADRFSDGSAKVPHARALGRVRITPPTAAGASCACAARRPRRPLGLYLVEVRAAGARVRADLAIASNSACSVLLAWPGWDRLVHREEQPRHAASIRRYPEPQPDGLAVLVL